MLKFEELKKGSVYKLTSRNLSVGVFDGGHGFIGIRTKFGSKYLFTEIEYDQDEHYGTARAIELLGTIPENIPLVETLGTACQKCNKPVNFDTSKGNEWWERWRHIEDNSFCCRDDGGPVSVGNWALFDLLEKYE